MKSAHRIALVLGLAATALLPADPLGQAVEAAARDQAEGRRAAAAVTAAGARTRDASLAATHARARHASLATYTEQVAEMVARQEAEEARLDRELAKLDTVRREVGPWLARAHASLEEFVARDLPFRTEARRERLTRLGDLLARPDLGLAEKAKRVLEAYRLEVAAARRVEADRDEVALPGGPRTVDLLRVGRVALYYRTLDGTEAGWWDAEKGAWRPLSAEHRPALEQALRVARQQSPPGLMWLPVPAPREAGS